MANQEEKTKVVDNLEDTVMGVGLEVRKSGMGPETETALKILAIFSVSVFLLWLIGSTATDRGSVITCWLVSYIIVLTMGFLLADKLELRIIFWLISFAVLVGTYWFSRYNNFVLLEKDQKIVEILQINVLKDKNEVEILLPAKYAKENSYLERVFSLGWEGEENKKKWKGIVVPCREGENYWFYARLPVRLLPPSEEKTRTAKLEMFFEHVWRSYPTTIEISLEQ